MRSNQISLIFIAASSLLVASCGDDGGIPGPGDLCGLECGTLAEGSASISGIASVDAFFSSVISFEGKANGVSAGRCRRRSLREHPSSDRRERAG